MTIRPVFALLWAASILPVSVETRAEAVTEVDRIIASHIQARGGLERIKAIRSLVFSGGAYREPGYQGSGDATMMLMRPYLKVVGDPEHPSSFMEGYDGAAWEWFGDPGLVIRTVGAASAASRHGADLEGPLVDYRAKGVTISLGEPATIDGRPAYRLIVVMRDGYRTEQFLDQQTHLIVASRHAAPIHAFGDAIASETRVEDYRPVAGVLFPHRFVEVEISSGAELSAMQWSNITANRELPTRWFSPPRFSRTRVQDFMHHLFVQRTDLDAVLWTYAEFRRVHPELDTRVAAEVIGYQMLKMGSLPQAVGLLEANARDYPDSADSAFGLGRALKASDRTGEARVEYERALRLEPAHSRSLRALEALDREQGAHIPKAPDR